MPWKIANGSTMAEVALDANVIVALLYDGDAYHARAKELRSELEHDGHTVAVLDFLLHEAVSVLCRRARERKTTPPDLGAALGMVRRWIDSGGVRSAGRESERLAREALDVILDSEGVLNFNDALVVLLKREGWIERFASFDAGFDAIPEFARLL
jgi:predicted nucleic acid-binding protein